MAVQFTFKRASALIAAATLLALIAGGALPAAAGASSAAVTWSPSQALLPANAETGATATAFVHATDCPSPGMCVAVGWYRTTGGSTARQPMADLFSGGSWSRTTLPLPADATATAKERASMSSISCAGPTACTAVGYYKGTTGHTFGLVEAWNGAVWAATQAPEPANAGTGANLLGQLTSVDCATSAACTAVGVYEGTTGHTFGLIETGSGMSWAATQAPEPANAGTGANQRGALESTTCPRAGTCVATGYYENATGGTSVFIVTLSNGMWTATQGPLPADASAPAKQTIPLTSVSCSSGAVCTAVGHYEAPTGQSHGLIVAVWGGTWVATAAPEPATAGTGTKQTAELVSVSCIAGGCAAGGSYETTSDGTQGLLETSGLSPSGYFEAASDGGIFSFTVPFHGSMGGKALNAPIVSSAADLSTGGYWEVASDGGIFAFTAPFLGSMGAKPLNKPVVGMAYDTLTGGYYLVASDGGLFAFTAPFHGSMGGKPLNQPVVGMAFDYGTGGYWEVASDGGIFSFGAPFQGSMGGKPLNKPVVTMSAG
jgi:hypothetical protein